MSHAVVIDTSDGSGNTTAPEDDPGFGNVGALNVGGAIYLGNRWVLGAAHVRAGAVEFGGVSYSHDSTQTVRLTNPESDLVDEEGEPLSELTDLMLLRLNEDPGLPALRLPCAPVEADREVLMIGRGWDRAVATTAWRVTAGPDEDDDVWEEVSNPITANRFGFKTQTNQTMRWGRNIVGDSELVVDTRTFGDIVSYLTSFDPTLGVRDLAQAVRGDSGGAAFQKVDGLWELNGVIHAVELLDNHPLGTNGAIYGDGTYIADLSFYADSIREIADFALPGDLNLDGVLDGNDIDFMREAIRVEHSSCHLDLDGNNTVDQDDFQLLLTGAGSLTGDANLDGVVGFVDFLVLSSEFGATEVGWGQGDFDGDREVTFADFLILSDKFGEVGSGAAGANAVAVPEPSGLLLFSMALMVIRFVVRSRYAARR